MSAAPAPRSAGLETVRLAIGIRSTAQSLAVVGLAAGAFRQAGIDLVIAGMETAGPAGITGLVDGDWDIAEFGAVPVVQWALEGHDPVILLAAEPRPALFIVGAADIKEPGQLRGRDIGVLTAAGQTGYCAAQMLGRWGLSSAEVSIASLKRYPVIFEELRAGRIAAGVLPADYRFAAAPSEGLSVLSDLSEEFDFQGPVVVTTRRLAAMRPDLVARVVEGYARAVHAFRTKPDLARAALRRHLDFTDEAGVARIYEFYTARFSRVPRASFSGLQKVLDSFVADYPAAASMSPLQIYDPSFLDALERDGWFNRIYTAAEALADTEVTR
ncbi:ABC transporter substrate-binding protein [Rhodopseudomonas palustris]|uniref:ABC transporter substrate-binding protein n=1 Tax=Rhodopseudomonas palustris TaxID=1076 RepID=A0A418V0P5_RHOPL|nr:ABC transporter substrate-binding protein [Rhodopseudomonas palustris]RJF69410.1 ABC transporter substrate-binding protein [Rhodopseudomonas palustris]